MLYEYITECLPNNPIVRAVVWKGGLTRLLLYPTLWLLFPLMTEWEEQFSPTPFPLLLPLLLMATWLTALIRQRETTVNLG